MRTWLSENWDRWEEDGGNDWFNAKLIGKIPSFLLPDKVLEGLGGEKGRKKSIALLFIAEEENENKLKKGGGVRRIQIRLYR